jgi:hypothetical protein
MLVTSGLITSRTLPQFEAQFQKHDIGCELEGDAATYEVKLPIQPKVTFTQGKAVKAPLNWGKIKAPKLAKTALGSATAADNAFGVWQGRVVDDLNAFIHSRCTESKEEWQAKAQCDVALGAPPIAPRGDLACALPGRAIRAKGAAFHDDGALLDSERHSDRCRDQHHLARRAQQEPRQLHLGTRCAGLRRPRGGGYHRAERRP